MGTVGRRASYPSLHGRDKAGRHYVRCEQDRSLQIQCLTCVPAMFTKPMPSINTQKAQMSDLRFFAVPPEIIPPSPTITRDPRRPMKNNGMSETGSLYLAVSYLDYDDCKRLCTRYIYSSMLIESYSESRHFQNLIFPCTPFQLPPTTRAG